MLLIQWVHPPPFLLSRRICSPHQGGNGSGLPPRSYDTRIKRDMRMSINVTRLFDGTPCMTIPAVIPSGDIFARSGMKRYKTKR